MHPNVVKNENGVCPVCGMDLVKIDVSTTAEIKNQFEMSERAMALANVQTNIIGKKSINKQVILSGEIKSNKKTDATQTTMFDGRLDKLDVNYIGEYVTKGQRIGTIYSPELYLAQDKLLTSSSYKDTHEKLYAAARNTLGLWKMTDTQIDDLIKSGKPLVNFPLVADVSGTVVEILASEGSFFKQGDPLFKVSQLQSVWAIFQAYESQLIRLEIGQEIVISSEVYKGKPISAKISFIEPILDGDKRIVSVRADIDNKNGSWKPGMFITGMVKIENYDESLIMVPKSAVLWTGEHSVVYKKPNSLKSVFEMCQIHLGESVGDYYVVVNGLNIGDEIVTNGAFTIDAAAQIFGNVSMMYSANVDSEFSFSKQEIVTDISLELNEKLKGLITLYLDLKNELVESNFENTEDYAMQLSSKLNVLDVDSLSDEMRLNIEDAKITATRIKSKGSLDGKRIEFKSLSKNFIFFATQIKGNKNPIYIQHCPMADNNIGADWLSLEKSIRNPYFGDSMLTCGKTVKVLNNF